MDREPEIKAILQKACDRDWKDETLYQTAVIASNAIYWRDREIEILRKRCNEADQRDAARYRWLRDYGHSRVIVGAASMPTGCGPYIRLDPPANNTFSGITLWAETADSAIDAAMSAQSDKEERK